MGLWETRSIWANNSFSAHLVFYARYIDDIIIIWYGPLSSVQEFVVHCNANIFGLSFTSLVDPESICFLDLELFHISNIITAKNYTKPTAGNALCWQNHKGPACQVWRAPTSCPGRQPTIQYLPSLCRSSHKAIVDLQVWIIESIPEKFTPAERFECLCRQETFSIYTLNTMTPHGLNKEIEINNNIINHF